MPDETALSSEDQQWLLGLARRTLESLAPSGADVPGEEQLIEGEIPAAVADACGAFVTLHKAGMLRGCIGYVSPVAPLYRAVVENAVNAARRDPRFPPVRKEEVSLVELEISVMTPPRPVQSVEEIEVGCHGLIVSQGLARGLLLPQVASENRWDRETFLDHTCRKAGLPMDAWRKGNAKIELFSAQVFSE